jgi:hypothetical protein
VEQQRLKEMKKRERNLAAAHVLPLRLRKSRIKRLQTHKRLYNCPKEARGRPHNRLHQELNVYAVQLRCKVVLRLHQLQRLHHPNSHEHDQSKGQIDFLSSTILLRWSNYYSSMRSRDNSYCGWCRSLMFVVVITWDRWLIGRRGSSAVPPRYLLYQNTKHQKSLRHAL